MNFITVIIRPVRISSEFLKLVITKGREIALGRKLKLR